MHRARRAHNPGHGPLAGSSARLNAALASLTYLPAHGYSGPDQLTIGVSDGSLHAAPAGVAITVKSAAQQAADMQAQVTALQTADVLSPEQARAPTGKLNLKGNNGDSGKVQAFLNKVQADGRAAAARSSPVTATVRTRSRPRVSTHRGSAPVKPRWSVARLAIARKTEVPPEDAAMPPPPVPRVAYTVEPGTYVVLVGESGRGPVCRIVQFDRRGGTGVRLLGSVVAHGPLDDLSGPPELEAEVLRALAEADAADVPVFAPRMDDRRLVCR